MPRPTTTHLVLLAAGLAASCGPSGATLAPATPAARTPAIGSTVLGGASDGLAVELLLASTTPALPAWHDQQVAVTDAAVAAALDAMAIDHLRSTALGAGAGPLLLGSATIRRLAGLPGAPTDRNGDGSNLDETLAVATQRIASYAGAVLPAGTAPPVLPWHSRSADLQAPLPANGTSLPWHTQELGDRTVRMTEVARFVQLRAIASRRLLRLRHGNLWGATDDEGLLGLLAMQQLLAAEDTLFTSMFTSGGPLGVLDPATYDPGHDKRWLPSEILVDLDATVAGAPAHFRAIDDASDLEALATVLQAAAELTSVTVAGMPFALPQLFLGRPFEPPPIVSVPMPITWTFDIGPLMTFHCGPCHMGPFGGFSIENYETMLLGGTNSRAENRQFVVPGNAAGSWLHTMLAGPPPPYEVMPQGSPLPAATIAHIDQWINEGALKDPPAPPPPPKPGEDLARVAFQNLVALHFDPATGALHHRYESDGPSGVATAAATGHALTALAQFDRIAPGTVYAGWTPLSLLSRVVESVPERLVDGDGRCSDAFVLATNARAGDADLRAQAAMTAGLLEAASRLPAGHVGRDLATAASNRLLSAFVDPASGLFSEFEGGSAGAYSAATLTDLLAALRLAQAAGVPGAQEQRTALLARLRPVLAFAEWSGHGELLGDGVDDTDGDGLPEPAAAGGEHGRLPLLADRIVVDAGAPVIDRPVTWSEHVRPLLVAKCGECHLTSSELGGMYRLDTVRALATPVEPFGAFPLLVPGDPGASFFYRKLVDRRPVSGMPMPRQRPPLDDFQKALVRRWIEQGASRR